MNKQKLHVAVTVAASSAVGKKQDEIKTIMESAWSESMMETKQDRAVFEFMFNDALSVCTAYSLQKLPSELAAEKH